MTPFHTIGEEQLDMELQRCLEEEKVAQSANQLNDQSISDVLVSEKAGNGE